MYLYLYLIIKSARFLPFFVRFPFALILDKNYINCHRISKKRFNPQSIICLDPCLPRRREQSGASGRRKWAPLARQDERSATSSAANRVYQLASLSSPPYPSCPSPPPARAPPKPGRSHREKPPCRGWTTPRSPMAPQTAAHPATLARHC
jgi:hypothetical protein